MRKIYNSKLIRIIIIILYFKPICIQYYSKLKIIESIFVYGKILAAIFILLMEIIKIRKTSKIKINNFLIAFSIWQIYLFIITIINKGDVYRYLIDFVSMFTFIVFVTNCFCSDKNTTISIFERVFFGIMLIQLLTEIIFPSGMPADLYKNNLRNRLFFETLDNGTTGLVCITIGLIFLDNKKITNIWKIIKLILCMITIVLAQTSTGIFCCLALIIINYFLGFKELKVLDKWYIWLFIYFIIWCSLMIGNGFLYDITSNITGKQSFTGRGLLWKNAIILIKKSPIYGYGIQVQDYISAWGGYYSSHNMLLEILLQGGIVGGMLWCNMLNKVFINKKNINGTRETRNIFFTIFCLLIAYLMEAKVMSNYLFLFLILYWNWKNIREEGRDERKEN